jgi:serine/threonine protein phosphatase PrpC
MNFKALSPNSRIWIFQSDRKLTADERENIRIDANHFTKNWVSHNNRLKAASEIFHDQFLVLGVDEDDYKASGCSIDSSYGFINMIEDKYILNLLQRDFIAFVIDEQIVRIHYTNIKKEIERGRIDNNTLLFNNLISKKSELDSKWLVSACDSWISRYL